MSEAWSLIPSTRKKREGEKKRVSERDIKRLAPEKSGKIKPRFKILMFPLD
jgi:hypothetical protein